MVTEKSWNLWEERVDLTRQRERFSCLKNDKLESNYCILSNIRPRRLFQSWSWTRCAQSRGALTPKIIGKTAVKKYSVKTLEQYLCGSLQSYNLTAWNFTQNKLFYKQFSRFLTTNTGRTPSFAEHFTMATSYE